MELRNILLSIILLCLLYTPNANAGDKSYGIRAGWQRSVFTIDGERTDPLSSFYLGIFKENKLAPLLHYGLGIEYMQCGGTLDYIPDQMEYKIGYLGIPVYLKANAGPVFGVAGSGINFKISEDNPGNDDTNMIDVPVYAGIGIKFLMFSIEARYHFGLIEVQDMLKNQYLQIGVGIRF